MARCHPIINCVKLQGFERMLQYIGCIYRKKGSQSEINVCRHYSVSAVTGWCVCVGGGGGAVSSPCLTV